VGSGHTTDITKTTRLTPKLTSLEGSLSLLLPEPCCRLF
jgi:hypothetical protein